MARDNGSRGYYRHGSPSTDEHEDVSQESPQQQLPQQLPQHLVSPASSDATATPPTTFHRLKPEGVDGLGGAGADRLFDLAPDLLNVRFPVMSQQQQQLKRSVPGSLPRSSPFPQQTSLEGGRDRDRVTWADVAIANLVIGSAVIGFLVIMYDGVSTITAFLWDGIMGMVSR